MRILVINHEFTITGASTVLLRLVTHLRAQGHSIVVMPILTADGPIAARYTEMDIPIATQATLSDFDLAIANTICAAPTIIKIAPRLPTIWFLHETEIGLNLLLKNNAWIPAFRMATAVIYQTAFQHDVYRSFTYELDPAKFHIVANGVDVVPEQLDRAAIQPKQHGLRVVQVGGVEARKRPGDLIQAVARSGLDIECVFCGKVYGLDKIAAALAEKAPQQYRILGEVEPEAALAWIESADVFCLASVSESQPVSTFEAAALARPLLLSDLPAYRHVFTHGRNCLMFPPGHIDMLAVSLSIYANSPTLRMELGRAAQHSTRHFTQAAFLRRFDAVIDTVLSMTTRPP